MGCTQSRFADPDDVKAAHEPQAKPTVNGPSPTAVAVVQRTSVAESPRRSLDQSSPISPLETPGICYMPEAEVGRLKALLDCKMLDTPDERRFDNITSLVKDLLQVPIALVSFIDSDRLWFKSVAGSEIKQGSRLHSFCDALLRMKAATMMVVPNTLEDVRFQKSQFVAGPPYVRFYAGAPLVSSSGHVLGTLSVLDVKTRDFPLGGLNIMCNFAELVVREMERDKIIQQQQVQALEPARRNTVRALSAFDEAVILCDVTRPGWPILFVNDQWCKATGIDQAECLKSGLWQLFSAGQGEGTLLAASQSIEARAPFALTLSDDKVERLSVEMRPATSDHMSAAMPHIGIPNFVESLVPGVGQGANQFYFGVVSPANMHGGMGSKNSRLSLDTPLAVLDRSDGASSVASSRRSSELSFHSRASYDLDLPESLADLRLGPMVGSGAFGRVFRGVWHDGPVAVKVVTTWVDPEEAESTGPMLEALLSKKLVHPSIVATHEYAMNLADEGDEAGQGQGRQHQQVWIVQQYCDYGTLGDAVDRGWLRTALEPTAPADMRAVLTTACEVAEALAFVHSIGVLHGDLTAANVLLASGASGDPRDPRPFTAKVGDFGLSRILDANQAQLVTNTCGTVGYMPLERIQDNLFSRAADVYSFGVLCWEMMLCQRAWAGRTPVQILYARTVKKVRLELPAGGMPGFKSLVDGCLDDDHTKRPTFEQIVGTLKDLLASL